MDATRLTTLTRRRLVRGPGRWLAAVVVVEALMVLAYFRVADATVSTPRYVVYPLVWITVGLWAVAAADPPRASLRSRVVAGVVAYGYFVVLVVLAGLVGLVAGSDPHAPLGFSIGMGSPGWGPRVGYISTTFYATLVPYQVVGYLALSYLVYVRILDATSAAAAGVLGFVSCIGCSFQIVASAVSGIAGGSSALTAAVYRAPIDASTGVFLLSIGLLYFSPAVSRRVRDAAGLS